MLPKRENKKKKEAKTKTIFSLFFLESLPDPHSPESSEEEVIFEKDDQVSPLEGNKKHKKKKEKLNETKKQTREKQETTKKKNYFRIIIRI